MDLSQFSKNPEQIRGLIALLESMLPKEDAVEDEDKQATPIEAKAKKRPGKQIKKKPAESKNKFSSIILIVNKIFGEMLSILIYLQLNFTIFVKIFIKR